MKILRNLVKAINPRFWVGAVKRSASPKTIYKWWRIDCNIWEEKVKILWFINYYKYSIWIKGKTLTRIRFKIYPEPKYLKKAHETKVYVGKKEFEENYKNNKWLVPINKELNLELP
jgi:hypothetical protein